MDFLQSLGQGLRIAGGGLSENVYNEQMKQDEIAQKTRQAQLAAQGEKRDAQITYLKQAVENGSMSLEDATKAASSIGGNLPIGLGASLAAQHARQLVTNEQQVQAAKQDEISKAAQFGMAQDALRQSVGQMVPDATGKMVPITGKDISAPSDYVAANYGPPELRNKILNLKYAEAPKKETQDVPLAGDKIQKQERDHPSDPWKDVGVPYSRFAKQVPTIVMPGTEKEKYGPDEIKTASLVVASDPARMRDYASFGAAGQEARIQIAKGITSLKKETGMSDSDFIQARARAKAQVKNIGTLTEQQAQVAAAEGLARKNGERVLELLDLVDQTGVPMIEGFSRSVRRQSGGVDVGELKSVLTAFQSETARILSGSPSMKGVISDSFRKEIEQMAPENMTTAQGKRIISRLFIEFGIRQDEINKQLEKGVGATVVGTANPPAPSGAKPDPLGIR